MRFLGFKGLVAIALLGALASPTSAQQSDSDPLRRLFEQGQKAIAERRYADASQALTKALELAPDIAEIHASLGFSYFQQGEFEAAVLALTRALKLKPGLSNADLLLAAAQSETGRLAEALPGLEAGFAKSSDPDLKRLAGLRLLRVHAGLGRDREAAGTALALAKLYPKDPEVLYHAGRLLGHFAFLSVQELTRTAPDSIWARQAAGEAYESAGQFERAIAEYRKVLEIDPDRRGARFRLGRALLRSSGERDAVEEAVKQFRLELRSDPTNANAAYELGEIHRKSGDLAAARDLFEQAVRHYPDFEQAQLALGGVLTSIGEPTRAIEHLQAAAELNPENEVAYYRLAQAHRALGETARMREALARFQRLRSGRAGEAAFGASRESVTAQRAEDAAP